jgi:hypothetical protein
MFGTIRCYLLVASLLFGPIESWRVLDGHDTDNVSPQHVLEDPIHPTNFTTLIDYVNVPETGASCFYKHMGQTSALARSLQPPISG